MSTLKLETTLIIFLFLLFLTSFLGVFSIVSTDTGWLQIVAIVFCALFDAIFAFNAMAVYEDLAKRWKEEQNETL